MASMLSIFEGTCVTCATLFLYVSMVDVLRHLVPERVGCDALLGDRRLGLVLVLHRDGHSETRTEASFNAALAAVLGRGAWFRVAGFQHFSLRGGLRALNMAFASSAPSLWVGLWALEDMRRDLTAQCYRLLGHYERL